MERGRENAPRILVAEDNPGHQALIGAMLQGFGLPWECVSDGREAVAAVERGRYDLVLMDISMPVMDGLTAIRLIRERERAAGRLRTPIVVVSSQDDPRDMRASRAAGADGHLPKPLSVGRLLQVVEAGLARASADVGADEAGAARLKQAG